MKGCTCSHVQHTSMYVTHKKKDQKRKKSLLWLQGSKSQSGEGGEAGTTALATPLLCNPWSWSSREAVGCHLCASSPGSLLPSLTSCKTSAGRKSYPSKDAPALSFIIVSVLSASRILFAVTGLLYLAHFLYDDYLPPPLKDKRIL